MNQKTIIFIYTILTVLFISGCSGKDKNQGIAKGSADVQSANESDITRPPEFVKRPRNDAEGDPNETISLDDWRKEQEARK